MFSGDADETTNKDGVEFDATKALGELGKIPTPEGMKVFLDRRAHMTLERSDDSDISIALDLYRKHPEECLYHMRMTDGIFKWNLVKNATWRAEFPDAAKHFPMPEPDWPDSEAPAESES